MSSSALKLLLPLLLFLASSAAASPSLIQQACTVHIVDPFDTQLCITTLGLYPSLASAPDLHELAIRIIGYGISYGKITRNYLDRALQLPNLPVTLYVTMRECFIAYNSVITEYGVVLDELTAQDNAQASTDLLTIAVNLLPQCLNSIKGHGGIKDKVVLEGNQMQVIFSASAFQAASAPFRH